MSNTGGDDRRQRLRDQMKQFYGDPEATKKNEAPRRNPGVPPEMDLDSEYFNVMKYTTDLMRRETLKGLVEADTDLLRHVRKLDRELQELVYRNYAKFISATDTIREMRDNVAQMDSKLQALSSKATSIDTVSKNVSDALREHRGRIEETISANRMLKKVQFLMDLPATMKRLLEKKEYSVCVKYWVAGDGFLEKHEGMPSIRAIHGECRTLAQELYRNLEETMCAVSLDDPEAMDTIRKIVENLRLLRVTSVSVGAAAEDQDDDASFENAVLRTLMKSVSANFTSGVTAVQRSVRSALAVPADIASLPLPQRADALAHANLRGALAQLKSVCALLSVNSEKVFAIMNRLDTSRVGIRVTQDVQPVLVDLLTPISKQLGELAVATLASIADEGIKALFTPEAVSSAMQAAVGALIKQLKHTATTLKTLGSNYLDTAHSQQSHSYALLVDQAVSDVLAACATALIAKVHEAPSAHRLAALPEASVAAHPDPLTATNSDLVDPSRHQRVGFCVSRFVYAFAALSIAHLSEAQLVQTEVVAAERVADPLASLTQVAKELQHRGAVLLGQLQGILVCPAFGPDGATDPTQGGTGIPEALHALIKEWTAVEAVLQSLWHVLSAVAPSIASSAAQTAAATANSVAGAAGTTAANRYSNNPRATAGLGGGGRGSRPTVSYVRREDAALQSNVARIFSTESSVLSTTPRDSSVSGTMGCVVLYLFKALVDYVRTVRVYNAFGFQRVQVGTTYLLRAILFPSRHAFSRSWLKEWDEQTTRQVQQLLDEVCACAYERCDAKTTAPLTDAIVDRIVEDGANAPTPSHLNTAAASLGGSTVIPSMTATAAATTSSSPPAAAAVAATTSSTTREASSSATGAGSRSGRSSTDVSQSPQSAAALPRVFTATSSPADSALQSRGPVPAVRTSTHGGDTVRRSSLCEDEELPQ